MTVDELIKELKRLSGGDGNTNVEVGVGSYYKAYPVAYLEIFHVDKFNGQDIRLSVSLGEEFVVRKNRGVK